MTERKNCHKKRSQKTVTKNCHKKMDETFLYYKGAPSPISELTLRIKVIYTYYTHNPHKWRPIPTLYNAFLWNKKRQLGRVKIKQRINLYTLGDLFVIVIIFLYYNLLKIYLNTKLDLCQKQTKSWPFKQPIYR